VAALIWLTPATGQTGTSVKLQLTGANFSEESKLEIDGSDVQISDVKIVSPTEIEGALKVGSGSPPGTRQITVSTPSGKSNSMPFRITARTRKS